jgi:vancomycin resistance protein YoaR
VLRPAGRRRHGGTLVLRRGTVLAVGATALIVLVGLAFAGSPARIAEGVSIAGVDVGGLTPGEAVRTLETRATAASRTPVAFTAAGHRFRASPRQLGVEADWRAAVALARRENAGFGPVRGFRRLHTRIFGEEISPSVTVYNGALDYLVRQIASEVDRPHVDAALRRRGLQIEVVPARRGTKLQRERAATTISRSLGSLERFGPVPLAVTVERPAVTAPMLAAAARRARLALSAPVRLTYGTTAWKLPRWRIAELLSLPSSGARNVAIAGPGADRWFAALARRVERAPVDASFAVSGGSVRVIPSRPGLGVDVPATARALATAAFSPTGRTAVLAVEPTQPPRTTEEAKRMGITGVVSSYTTSYGGTPGRLHNVQLVAQLIDDTLIPPGKTFSFNATTGERTPEKGFQTAPVIINGELQNGIGGGVCQVSTTVFNAAFEAGLSIEERTNHALYISHYPLGRDATVDYPSLDLKFKNDTGRWLLLRTFVGSGSLTVNLYGTPQHRRVESFAAPLVTIGPVPVQELKDPALAKGKRVVDVYGSPPRSTSVHRVVYGPNGKVMYDSTWSSRYVGEPSVVRVGTKPPPKKKKPKAAVDEASPTQSAGPDPTTTEPSTTPVVPQPR